MNMKRISFRKHMKPAAFKGKWDKLNRGSWIAQRKEDGYRVWLVIQPYGKVEIFSSLGKRMPDIEPFFQNVKNIDIPMLLDGELVVFDRVCQCKRTGREEGFDAVAHYRSEHPEVLGIRLFDVLQVEDEEYQGDGYWFRWDLLKDVVEALGNEKIKLVDHMMVNGDGFNDWVNGLEQSGAEGVVFKDMDSYYTFGSRRVVWLKHKWGRKVDVDVVIKAVLPPSEKMDQNYRRLGYGYENTDDVFVFPMHVHKNEALNYLGRVAELSGYSLMPSGAVLYPRFVRWRPDKLPEECLLLT